MAPSCVDAPEASLWFDQRFDESEDARITVFQLDEDDDPAATGAAGSDPGGESQYWAYPFSRFTF